MSPYANINIQITKDTKWTNILKVGDMTPVIVKISQYAPLNNKISIVAEPFMPKQETHNFILICDPPIDNEDDYVIKAFKKIIADYNSYFSKLDKSKKDILKFFHELIYPYKKVAKIPSAIKLKNIKEAGTDKSFTITKLKIPDLKNPNAIIQFDTPYLNDEVYIIDEFDMSNNPTINTDFGEFSITKVKNQDAVKMILTQYIKRLYTLMKFVETYNTKEMLNKSSHIWKYYELNKK